jgi:hypothetical protein
VSLDALLTRAATLYRRTYDGPPDELGDPTWTEITGPVACELQQAGSTEALGDAVQVSTWRVFLPVGASDVGGWDALELDGDRYELVGDPWPVWNPRLAAYDHVEALVQRVR